MEEKTEEVSPIFIALIYTLMVSKLDQLKLNLEFKENSKKWLFEFPPRFHSPSQSNPP